MYSHRLVHGYFLKFPPPDFLHIALSGADFIPSVHLKNHRLPSKANIRKRRSRGCANSISCPALRNSLPLITCTLQEGISSTGQAAVAGAAAGAASPGTPQRACSRRARQCTRGGSLGSQGCDLGTYSVLGAHFLKYLPFHSTLYNSGQAEWAQRPIQHHILRYTLGLQCILFVFGSL